MNPDRTAPLIWGPYYLYQRTLADKSNRSKKPHKYIPLQRFPLAVKPILQLHVYPPSVSIQT